MSSPIFTGVGVALVTVFDADGGLRPAETAAHAAELVAAGLDAVVVAGTTGEAMSLDAEERDTLIAAVRAELGGRVPVIAGTGAPSARQAVELSRRAAAAGADGLLVLSPPRVPDPRPYYERVAAAVEVPVLGYHFPDVSPPGLPLDGLAELPIVGLKDSGGDPDRLAREVTVFPDGVYVGRHALALQARAVGCSGVILAMANLDPAGCLAAWGGDGEAQRRLVVDHLDAGSIPALKQRLAEQKGIDPSVRIG